MKDKKIKKTGKKAGSAASFNVVDLLIIVVILACITGVVLRYTVLSDTWSLDGGDVYYITFRADSLSYTAYSTLLVASSEQNDNWLYLDDGITELGSLSISNGSSIAGMPDNLTYRLADGSELSVPYSSSENDNDVTWTLTGKIMCHGKIAQDGGFLLNGQKYISINDRLTVYSKYCDLDLTVTGIAPSLVD